MLEMCRQCGHPIQETGLCTCYGYDDEDESLDFRETVRPSGRPRARLALLERLIAQGDDTTALTMVETLQHQAAAARAFLTTCEASADLDYDERCLIQHAEGTVGHVLNLMSTLRRSLESGDAEAAHDPLSALDSALVDLDRLMSELQSRLE